MSHSFQSAHFIKLALDRSVREYDDFGRLHVKTAHISKANVCPYYGHEIPNYQELGLKRDEIYKLLRHPDELEKSKPTWNNLPVLRKHIPHSADEPQKKDVVGSTGTDASFSSPYMDNSLVVWDGEAIALIESEDQKELSCGYAYIADMTPGEYRGERYDGVMRDITGNHVALVEEGRAGPDVVIGDAKPQFMRMKVMPIKAAVRSRKALMVKGALAAYLNDKLASDARIDLTPAVENLTRFNFDSRKDGIIRKVTKLTKGKLAADADIADLVDLLDAMSDVNDGSPDDDEVDAVDTERNTLEPDAGGAGGPPDAAGGGAPPPPGGGGAGGVIAELQQAGCPQALLAKVQAALGAGGGGAPPPAAAAPPPGGEKPPGGPPAAAAGPPGAEKPPAAAGPPAEKSDGPPEKKPDGNDSNSDELAAVGADDNSDDLASPGADEEAVELMPGNDEDIEEEEDKTLGEDEEDDDEDKLGEDEESDDPLPDTKVEGGPAKDPVTEGKLTVDAKAMDAAIKKAVAGERSRAKRLREAEDIVRPYIGLVVGDSARSLYKMALEAHDVDLDGVHPSAYKAMVKMLPKPSSNTPRSIAMDGAAVKEQTERWPNLSRLRTI